MVEYCLRRSARDPDDVVFRFLADGETETATLTYGELFKRAQCIAWRLSQIARPGDRVLVILPPGLEFVAAIYACFISGVIAVPCPPPLPRRTPLQNLRAIAEQCGATEGLVSAPLAARLPGWLEQHLGWNALTLHATEDIPHDVAPLYSMVQVAPRDTALVVFTSGATSAPKGVVLTHDHLIQNLEMLREVFCKQRGERGVCWLPPYHDMGLIGGVFLPVYLGAPMVLMPPSAFLEKPVRWLRAISRYGATITGAPNFAYDLCVARVADEDLEGLQLADWRVAWNGGEPVRWSTLRQFGARFGAAGFRSSSFVPCYGLAENTLWVAGVRPDDALRVRVVTESSPDPHPPGEFSVVCCGAPAPRTELRVVDPDTREERPEGEIGEIWVRSPSVGRGYWGALDRTRETFEATLPNEPDMTYLRTGDLGLIEGGRLYVTGRLNDVIIVRGHSYPPPEPEPVAELADSAE